MSLFGARVMDGGRFFGLGGRCEWAGTGGIKDPGAWRPLDYPWFPASEGQVSNM